MFGSQNGRQFDEVNGEESVHKQKIKLYKQFFGHYEQQPQRTQRRILAFFFRFERKYVC